MSGPAPTRSATAPRRRSCYASGLRGAGAAAVLATTLAATAGPAAPAAQVWDLRRDLEGILDRSGWRSAEWGVFAVSLENGDTLFAHDAGVPRTPASNMKLLTTAAALHHLGPDWRYTTFLMTDGRVDDGVLRGDLVLYGTGDPGLSDRFFESETTVFESLVARLRDLGVHTIDGNVVGDGSYFGGPLIPPTWDAADLNDWFAAPVSALSFNENVVTFRVQAGPAAGARPIVRTVPELADVPYSNEASTEWGRLHLQRENPVEPVRVVGSIPLGGRDVWREMTIGDPARYAAGTLRNVLEEAGVRVLGSVRTITDAAASPVTGSPLAAPGLGRDAPHILAVHESPPILEYLTVVNQVSHNLLAEMTLKTLGRVVAGDGSFHGGGRVVESFLADAVGLDTARIRVADGSGLSEENSVSPGDLVAVLGYMAGSDMWEAYWSTLPEAGDRRGLRRMYRTEAAGNLRAKTGTIRGVSALSGVVRARNGERIAFSIVGNGLPSSWAAKRIEDRIGTRLARFDRPVAAATGAAAEVVPPAPPVSPPAR